MTAQEILDYQGELWLNTPEGYPFAQQIEKSNTQAIKSFLISTTADEQIHDMIRQMEPLQVIQSCLDNNFTFDEQWYGARLFDWQKQ